MKKRLKYILPPAVLAIGVGSFQLLVATAPEVEPREPESYAPVVEVITVEPQPHNLEVVAHGVVEPARSLVLVSEVAGRLVELGTGCAEGAFFDEGARLFVVDPTDYELAAEAARAQVARAEAALQIEQAEGATAREDWAIHAEGAPTPLASREPQLAAAAGSALAARAALQIAERDVDRCVTLAPFRGRMQELLVEAGQWIAPGTPLAAVYATDRAEVALSLQLPDIELLELDFDGPSAPLAARLAADIGGERREWIGQIVRVGASLDPRSRMMGLVAVVEDPFRATASRRPMTPGLFVEATIRGKKLDAAVLLPRRALLDGDRVLVLDAENRVYSHAVVVTQRLAEVVVISEGLKAGSRVCLTPLATFVPGMTVKTSGESSQ